MLTAAFDYVLPPELIAQTPIEPRDASRLLVVDCARSDLQHRTFRDIVEYLRPGDLLVANETRVIPARLYAHKWPSGGKVELLLLAKRGPLTWEALVKGRKVALGQRLALVASDGTATDVAGTVEEISASGGRLIRFDTPVEPHLQGLGTVPLPPYIHTPLADSERYQTIYAREEGSVAAPTAGLHFTPELRARLDALGVEWATVLLHIGLDTFRPVTEERVEEHQIHTEYCRVSPETAATINRAVSEGRRVIAVGTTSVRVLETSAQGVERGVLPYDGPTQLFIYPGYRFRVVSALITNFHLPRSSLLMLVSAMAGLERIRQAYAEATRLRYRFYSFGDSMLILP
ncbi:MAG: tRNA preQ1(34) S-adenosylmethionine ribosyltransferase-isomerase QueA [Chloroflexi bacterium]|nr:tRNA preQ1(34) S-adenosylmethionine ribosyltransferase-isomerase QueA [Chloroflexota bacterium]